MNTAAEWFIPQVPRSARWLPAAGLCLTLAACHPGASTAIAPGAKVHTYAIGGEVRGLRHGVLVLQNNGGDTLALYRDGYFRFPTRLAAGSGYEAAIAAQPRGEPRQRCALRNGSGVIGRASVRDLAVLCESRAGDG